MVAELISSDKLASIDATMVVLGEWSPAPYLSKYRTKTRRWETDEWLITQTSKAESKPGYVLHFASDTFYIEHKASSEWIQFVSDDESITISSDEGEEIHLHDGLDACYGFISLADHIKHYCDVYDYYHTSVEWIIPEHLINRFHNIVCGGSQWAFSAENNYQDERVPRSVIRDSLRLMRKLENLNEEMFAETTLPEITRIMRGCFNWHFDNDVDGVSTRTWVNDRYVISFTEVHTGYGTDVFIVLDRLSEEYVVFQSSEHNPFICTKNFTWCYTHDKSNYRSYRTFAEKIKFYSEHFTECCITMWEK